MNFPNPKEMNNFEVELAEKILPPTVFWRILDEIPPALTWSLMAVSIITPMFIWWLVANSGWVEPLFLPTPEQVWASLWDMAMSEHLFQDILASLWRVSGGFLLAAIISVPLGILMGAMRSIRALFEPIIAIIRYMPATAFTPLLILYFGIGELPKILLIFIGTLFFNTLMIMDAVKFIPKELVETTYTLGGNRIQVILQVICPYVLPNIIDACRVNIAAAWNLVIVSELVAATEGLGHRIIIAQKFLKTEEIFVCLILIGLIGFTIDQIFRFCLRCTCPWVE
ncbi:ABC transporter permease [[Phormidium] sp. ETS-05]|uniref:ABC transporter permease n=1 Tax=[Phormidium] sp. ETS-05 TaxID=222819 RepID=UPI0018EEDD10|nr:ABC transporter permease [[Phormidium] sp. ETS-05]